MTNLSAHLYADLIGKPFRFAARGPDAFDCWGILQCVLQRMGHTPTDFPSNPALLQQAISDEWQRLDGEPQPGDAILLRSYDTQIVWHVALVLSLGTMLHAHEVRGVCAERYDSPIWRRRIAGFYRFRGRPD